MARSRYITPLVGLLALVAGPTPVRSLDMQYCASISTAQTPTNSSIYQSDGLCHDFCNKDSWAFAIVQAFSCWCSDYIPDPSSQVDTSKCNRACPGWPQDTCGAKDLYGYMQLDSQPSGTKSDNSGPTSTPTPTRSSSSSKVLVSSTSTSTSVVHITTSPTSTTSSTTSTSSEPEKIPTDPASSTSPSSTQSTSTSAPGTTIKTVTAGGSVSIVTVYPSSTSQPGAVKPGVKSSKGLNSGAIAGIVIGILAVIVIALAAIFVILRKRRQREEELASRTDSHLSGSPGVMSGTPTTAMTSVWDGENTGGTGRRSSRLMPHDPRMDPFTTNIYARFDNKSRESINTLQDNQDYSRKVLRTTNPDPDDD
ncbi:hypothetical protein F5Y17DRAFT_48300 [Xylariaceae sp. FL0594]|nr:hypothetical protein F5Y17DRAFT_48300 [Xylariaceae sp. FL0594]